MTPSCGARPKNIILALIGRMYGLVCVCECGHSKEHRAPIEMKHLFAHLHMSAKIT